MNVDENQLIVDNAMKSTGCNSEAELARMMGMLPQNFNQKKKRGTIAKAINRFLEKTVQPAASTPSPLPSVRCPADAEPKAPPPDAPTLRDILNLQEAMRILTREMGTEIGKLKEQVIKIQERMLDASTSKDISRLYFRGDEKEVFKN